MVPSRIAIVTPVFNDWDALQILINKLSFSISNKDIQVKLIAVDDSSTIRNYPKDLSYLNNIKVEIIRLKNNLGHQRAIAVGLYEAFIRKNYDGVVVMDSDGEDKVDDILALINTDNNSIVVAKRSTRSEGLKFLTFYNIYKLIFKILSGKVIDFGNFCYIPINILEVLIYSPNIWNHLAASIVKSNFKVKKVSTSRGKRYCGKSKLNFTGLVLHGLGAMSVFIDLIFTRIIFFLIFFISFIAFLALIVLGLKLFTQLSTPGWTTTLLGIFSTVTLQAIIIIVVSAFMVLNTRSTKLFIPAKDASYFILERMKIN